MNLARKAKGSKPVALPKVSDAQVARPGIVGQVEENFVSSTKTSNEESRKTSSSSRSSTNSDNLDMKMSVEELKDYNSKRSSVSKSNHSSSRRITSSIGTNSNTNSFDDASNNIHNAQKAGINLQPPSFGMTDTIPKMKRFKTSPSSFQVPQTSLGSMDNIMLKRIGSPNPNNSQGMKVPPFHR